MEYKPIARSSDLVVQEIGNETLVYDLKTHNAKCLNETSAAVWKLCDGKRNAVDISMSLSAQFKTSVDQELVWLAFDQLNKEDLLKSNGTEFALQGTSRRELIKKVGFAAVVAIPVVSSVIAPRAVNAQSVPPLCTPGAGVLCTCVGTGVNSCRAAVNTLTACYLTSDVRCTAGSACPPNQPSGTKCCVIDTGPSGDPNNCPPT